MSGTGPGQSGDISKQQRALRTTTAERLEAVVEAAERAAEGVIDDAERQARRYLAQARAEADRLAEGRISGLEETIDSLLVQAASLREEAERLQATLEAAKAQIEDDGEASLRPVELPREAADEPPPRLRAVEPDEEPAPAAAGKRSDAAGARLLATQMAVEGRSREEIEQRLRNGFEIDDTAGILDAILGPEEQQSDA
jgi:cell division septum initiation protein DivIVA